MISNWSCSWTCCSSMVSYPIKIISYLIISPCTKSRFKVTVSRGWTFSIIERDIIYGNVTGIWWTTHCFKCNLQLWHFCKYFKNIVKVISKVMTINLKVLNWRKKQIHSLTWYGEGVTLLTCVTNLIWWRCDNANLCNEPGMVKVSQCRLV